MLTISAAFVVSYSSTPIVSFIAIICSIFFKISSKLSIFSSSGFYESALDSSFNSSGICSTFLEGLVKRFLMRLVELLKKPMILLSDSLF